MTTYYIRPMGDGTFRVRYGLELVRRLGSSELREGSDRSRLGC